MDYNLLKSYRKSPFTLGRDNFISSNRDAWNGNLFWQQWRTSLSWFFRLVWLFLIYHM